MSSKDRIVGSTIDIKALYYMELNRLFLFFIFILTGLLYLLFNYKRPKNFPKGPWHLPFYGTTPIISRHDPNALVDLSRLSRTYGNVFSISKGNRFIIVVCDFPDMKKFLVNNGLAFCGRPKYFETDDEKQKILTRGLSHSNYSEEWRRQKKSCSYFCALLERMNSTLESDIQTEITDLYKTLAIKKDSTVPIRKLFMKTSTNLLLKTLYNERFPLTDTSGEQIYYMLYDLFEKISEVDSIKYNPLLYYHPNYKGKWKEYERCLKLLRHFLEQRNIEHKTTVSDFAYKQKPKDFVQTYFQDLFFPIFNTPRSFKPNEDWLDDIVEDLIISGVEPISSALSWCIYYMIDNPSVQLKVQEELDSIIPEEKLPSLKDRHKLPFTEASVLESLRLGCIYPIAIPHATLSRVTIDGRSIKRGTEVWLNLFATSRDPKLWEEPEEFVPERFLNDVRRVTIPEYWVPFGIGERSCAWQQTSLVQIFLIFASIMKKFSFHTINASPLSSCHPIQGGLTRKPADFQISVSARDHIFKDIE
ncbi:DgyrCDS1052 [Dimorphilus gyrociliatus]|uniref:DgyrCDS1052 n=1 Tax=Dimorphilus gyrociliatus TaxID=2664684 RepID=A0A7I8V864_9ANNE|nr:DgyrCDS1052 [Dimorphilus gyrociliatus]